MDFKSQKLTNILLLIITSIFVLAFLWAVCRGITSHTRFGWHFDNYKMWGEYKSCNQWLEDDNYIWKCENEETCPRHLEEIE